MNCEHVINNIPVIIKREILSYDRILMIEHIKSCKSCRVEYHKFLKIYYLTDYNLVQPEPDIENDYIDIPSISVTKPNPKRIIYAIAASFLILVVSMFLIIQPPDGSEPQSGSQEITFSQKLANEEWQEISKIIQDKSALKRFEYEQIHVDLLLVKLESLERNRINRLKFEEFTEENLGRRIELNSLINLLKKYKKYNSQLSMKEISEYLDLI